MIGKRYITDRSELGADRAKVLEQLEVDYWMSLGGGALDDQVGFTSLYVTGACHLKCPHCHAEEFFPGLTKDASTEQIIRIINALSLMTSRIQLTGGEVFVRTDPLSGKSDLPLLVKEIQLRGHETIMQTTGMHLNDDLIDFFAAHGVTWIALSLDGPDSDYNSRIRGTPVAFIKTLEMIPKLKARGIKVKIGTAITALNQDIDKILDIGRLIVPMGVDHWKLYQFYPREVGRASGLNADRLGVSDDDYNAILAAVTAEFGNSTTTGIVRHDLDSFYNAPCLLVQPNGLTTIMQGTADVPTGDLLTDGPVYVMKQLAKYGGVSTITANAHKTY